MIPHTYFYLTDDDAEWNAFYDEEWSLNCETCTRVGVYEGYLYKVVDQPEEEGWTYIDGKICCDLCSKEVKP